MPPHIMSKADEVTARIPKRIYNREAVILAAKILSRRTEFFWGREDASSLAVTMRAPAGSLPQSRQELVGEFFNEILNQDLRLGLTRANSPILKLITAKTLSSARGRKRPALRAGDKKALEKTAARLISQARTQTAKR